MEKNRLVVSFKDLGLSEGSLESVRRKGFSRPTEIQTAVIPLILRGDVDVVGQSRTGTGKTAAFALPVLEKIEPENTAVQVLVLTPTRELALQVSDEIRSLNRDGRIVVYPIYGGQPIEPQIRALRRGVQIVVGTPGRILDHLGRETLRLDGLRYLVLDEADRMLDMGFVDDIERIIFYAPSSIERRTLLFSATIPREVVALAKKYTRNCKILRISGDRPVPPEVGHEYVEVEEDLKLDVLVKVIKEDFHGIVFCRTKVETREVAWSLRRRGLRAEALNGDMSQRAREATLGRFRTGTIDVLVATDVASRGLDIRGVNHVINYSIPDNPKEYIHRIGRTGRMGRGGMALTFVRPSEVERIGHIARAARITIERSNLGTSFRDNRSTARAISGRGRRWRSGW